MYFNPGWFSPSESTFFAINPNFVDQPQNKLNVVGRIVLQVDPDRINHQRTIYNLLDFLGDVGGLLEALRQMGALCLFLLGKNGALSGYLVKSLLKTVSSQESSLNREFDPSE